jgi:hypothetical protein
MWQMSVVGLQKKRSKLKNAQKRSKLTLGALVIKKV